MKCFKLFALSCALTALCAASASASITYVDASAANTVAVSTGAVLSAATVSTSTNAVDGLWRSRAFGNGGTIYASSEAGAEDCLRLATSAASLADGTYDVYAYFWSPIDDNQYWKLRAGLTNSTSDLALAGSTYNVVNNSGYYVVPDISATKVASSSITGTTVTNVDASGNIMDTGNRYLLQAYLGQSIVSGGTLTVYVDDYVATNVNARTWYDGIGYSVAVPEPSTIALLCLGGLALAFRARRK